MKAVFLDRDGTITKRTDLVTREDELEIEEHAAAGIKLLKKLGLKVIVITNQPQIARGLVSEEDVGKMNVVLTKELNERGAHIDGIYFCPHHPEMHPDVPEHAKKYRVKCECRKPNIGMIKQAAKDHGIDLESSFFIGDSRRFDVQAGKNAGCRTILVKTGLGGRDAGVDADYECDNLLEAAKIIDGLLHTKVLLLAGGKGERLMPLTRDIPKPMVEIGGKPAMQHHIELAKKHGLEDIVICTSHMADKIKNYFGDGSAFGVRISYPDEPLPLGSGGAIKNAAPFLEGCKHFVVLNADVMTNIDIGKLLNFHLKNNGLATMVVRYSDHPKDSDVVEVENEKIVSFVGRGQEEKNIGNTGLMVLRKDVLDKIPEGFCNIEKDVIFKLIGKEEIYGYLSDEYIKDFGTPERLESVRKRFGD